MELLGVSPGLHTSKSWSGKQAGAASAGLLGRWVIKRDRRTFCANVNMLSALGKSDWQLLNEYWGKHCLFLLFSSLARDGDAGYINLSSGRQFIIGVLSSLAFSRRLKCDRLAAWFTSAFAGMLQSGHRASNQNNKRMCVTPSWSLSIFTSAPVLDDAIRFC